MEERNVEMNKKTENATEDKGGSAGASGSQRSEILDDTKNKSIGRILAVIRISGMVKVNSEVSETLERLKLRRKYACVLIDSGDKNLMGMLEKVKFYVSYGEIDDGVLSKLIVERGENKEGRKKKIEINGDEVVNGIRVGKKLSDFGLKDFLRLHPPRGGIISKMQYPKGVLGNNKKINELIRRML